MSIHRLHPELINLVAAQLDSFKDVEAVEGTCRYFRNAVQDAGPSSAWGQVFHRNLQRWHQQQVTLELAPPQNYRGAARALSLKYMLSGEIKATQRKLPFMRLDLNQPLFRQLEQRHQEQRRADFSFVFDRLWAPYGRGAHPAGPWGEWVEGKAHEEIFERTGQDPTRALAYLKARRSGAL